MITLRRAIEIIRLKIKAHTETDVEDWVQKRRDICSTCPLNSKHVPYKKRNLRYWKWYLLNLGQNFCSICGCELSALTLGEFDSCKAEKWTSQ